MALNSPKVYRGIPTDQQTQVGNFGTQLQVLKQQGYVANEEFGVLDFYIQGRRLPACMKCMGYLSNPDRLRSALAGYSPSVRRDERTDECSCNNHLGQPGEDK